MSDARVEIKLCQQSVWWHLLYYYVTLFWRTCLCPQILLKTKINLGSWKNRSKQLPHMFPHMAHVIHVMYSTLYWSISVPPLSCLSATWHLGSHDLCMFQKRFIHLESRPKSLSKLKCHKGIVWICKLFALFVLLNLHWVPKRSYSGALLATQAWSRST